MKSLCEVHGGATFIYALAVICKWYYPKTAFTNWSFNHI